jgi:ABC-type amino acid transport substrate-binding protein
MLRTLCCFCLLTLAPAFAQAPMSAVPATSLSEEQLRWAAGRTIRVGSDPAFAPFSHRAPDGTIQGVDPMMLDAITSHTGLKFLPVPYGNWPDAWKGLENGEVDVLTGCAETPDRLAKALFTQPYARPRLAIIARHDAGHGWSMEDLAGLTLAIPRAYAQLEDIRQRLPEAQVSSCTNLPEALRLVATRQADATIMSLASAVALLPQADYKELRVTGFYDREFPLRLAVRADLPELVPVLDGALSALRHQSAGAAYANWVDGRLDEWADQGRQLRQQRTLISVLSGAAAALGVVAAVGWWRRRRPTLRSIPSPRTEIAASTPKQLLEKAFDLTSIPMLVVQPPDLILDRNATARSLFNGTMVLPPELSAVAARLAALPPETPETVEWAPPGQPIARWQARLLPLPEGRSLLTLVP